MYTHTNIYMYHVSSYPDCVHHIPIPRYCICFGRKYQVLVIVSP